MTATAPGFPTAKIDRPCPACGKPVALSWRKGGNFGARCEHMTDVLGKNMKPTQCGTWVALTPVQSRAILERLEKEQSAHAEKKTEEPSAPKPVADDPPASGAKPRAERKPKPADDPPRPAAERPAFLTWGGKRIF